ncbi:unnamed protein product [Amaranthus hypochondriacus]
MKTTIKENNEAKVSTTRFKNPPLLFAEVGISGKSTRALIDTGASHKFIELNEASRLGVNFVKENGQLKTVNSSAISIRGIAQKGPITLGESKGAIDFPIVSLDDFPMVLGL